MAYPKDSDWESPVTDYFTSDRFIRDREKIIVKYLGEGATRIIDRISTSAEIGPYEEIIISNREKDLQYQELIEATERDKNRQLINNLLVLTIIVVFMVLITLIIRFRIKSKANALLQEKNETIAQRNKQLSQLNEEKNDLINILAHDLRSPLSNILNLSLMFQENENLSEEDRKLNGYISRASQKMATMISKILDVEAIESGQKNLIMERFDLIEVFQNVITDFLQKAKNKKIEIDQDLCESMEIHGDKYYANQIIANLLSNAIKYSNSGTTIRVRANELDQTISISDEGPGFSEEDQQHLFKKFHRLSAQPTAGEETVGLGLSIVKSYVDMIGAEITYETRINVGTTFFVKFQK